MRTFKTVTTQKLTTVVCDSCGLQASDDSDYEFHDFISICCALRQLLAIT